MIVRAVLMWQGAAPDGTLRARLSYPLEGPAAGRGDLLVEAMEVGRDDDWCRVAPGLVREDILEIALKAMFGELTKVRGHAEPVGKDLPRR